MPPVNSAMIGLMISPTSDCTMAVKAAPMMMPTAMSMTLPLAMKSLNSLIIVPFRQSAGMRFRMSCGVFSHKPDYVTADRLGKREMPG